MRRKVLGLVLVIGVVTATAAGADPPVIQRLRSELQGQQVKTKITLANYIYYVDPSGYGSCERLVDTEITATGSVAYLVRRGCADGRAALLFDNTYVAQSELRSATQTGSTVWITKIDGKDDRIEFQLTTQPGSNSIRSYAKLKLMLGKNWQKQGYEDLMPVLARAFLLAAYERLLILEAEFQDLTVRLAATETDFRSGSSAKVRLVAARELKRLLDQAVANRVALAAAGRPDSSSGFRERQGLVEKDIAALVVQAREEQIAESRERLRNLEERRKALKSAISLRPSAGKSEWDQRAARLDEYSALLQEEKTIHAQIGDAKDGFAGILDQESVWLRQQLEAHNADRSRLEARARDSEYAAMQQKRVRLLDAYTRAFGTADERSALRTLILHLEQMVENRRQAEATGDKKAGTQASILSVEVEKLRRR